ncbi:transglutaminaseTgpA domain-containing protein [Paenibacillus filicis]|uniref:TransglutaminaseTgpA domain-containing protein n=1 Tax=Paenibacillus filicis TaxID=669464 RepID=A0ABU9DMR4_9BACL
MSGATMNWRKRLLFDQWPHRLTVLLCGLYLLQLVFWFQKEDYWWLPETVVVVQLTLLTVAILEHIPWLHWMLRGILQLMGIVFIQVTVLQSYKVIEPMTLGSFFSSKLFLNLYELTPYLWFGLGAWVAYLTLIWWVESKWRIYFLLVGSVLTLCIRDSFSSVYLWPQVAVMVGCGLFLVILAHFRRLRQKDPAAWRHLADYPVSIVAPVAVLIILTLLVGIAMPEVRPAFMDPYTAWRAYRGEPMNFSTGKGVQVSAALDALDASSGYSRNDRFLGSGFQFDYTPVMTVNTTHRGYWRGESLALYTGRGWQQSEQERGTWTQVRADSPLATDLKLPGDQMKTLEVTQTVTLLTDEKYPVLFGAYAAQRVLELNGGRLGFDALQWSPSQGELRYSERVPYPKTYTIVSQLPIIDEAALRSLTRETPRQELAPYLQLPDQLPERVRTLAQEITKNATNDYDRAKMIEQYLNLNYSYTNKPDLTKGRSRDFVDRFLFEIKQGYCDYFSTSMAVLSRSVGLPTRWVKGYSSGTTAIEQPSFGFVPEEAIDPNAAGLYTVRNSDAHSWVEVYFSGYGWVPFEPTAGFTMPRALPVNEPVVDTTPAPPLPEDVPVVSEPVVKPHYYTIGGAVLAVLALMAFVVRRWQLVDLLREKVRRRRASLLKQKLIVECERLLRIFRRHGYIREEHETLREAVRRWTTKSRWMKGELDIVLNHFEKAKYGKEEITEEDWRQTAQIVEKLRSQM